MTGLLRFLANVFIRSPQEFAVALLRLLFMLFLLVLVLLLRFWKWLIKRFCDKNLYPEEKEEKHCGRLPEAIVRRPDPCIYSQRLLQSQGLPVTWNNPDIWVARADSPGVPEPDSYHLVEDTDYIVSVRVHNAAADLALGVRVRLNYRPWSFNSPDLTPVETDASGNEQVRFVDVMPMGSTITQFHWHTPTVGPNHTHRHFCLQASLYHPMDVNTSNNMGQENTNVYSANPGHVSPGEEIRIQVPLFNTSKHLRQFIFEANTYAVDETEKFDLRLKTIRAYAHWSASQRLANMLPTLHPRSHADAKRKGRFDFQVRERLRAVQYTYEGYDAARKAVLRRSYFLPPGMAFTANGRALRDGVEIKANGMQAVEFVARVPEDARRGSKLPVNIVARSQDGVLAGGVSLLLQVK